MSAPTRVKRGSRWPGARIVACEISMRILFLGSSRHIFTREPEDLYYYYNVRYRGYVSEARWRGPFVGARVREQPSARLQIMGSCRWSAGRVPKLSQR
jgi:hypothetical protein